ncbi:MAG: glycosyltransferase family 39 protein [Patescibacteria group bacterium]
MLNTTSFHIDEYLTAHYSYSLGDLSKLDWFGMYPPVGEWICQFPLLYFFFQKLFFNIFGLSTLTMRFSILPYITIIFVSLFLLTKRLYNEKTAITAILIFAIFSPDLYLSRWSLHFVSSTALFLLTAYFLTLSLQVGKKINFALLGFFLATCYMTYYSSYIAAPLVFAYLLVLIITRKVTKPSLINFLLSLGIFLYAISPIIAYATKVDNFFTQRTTQVALINGLWSPYQNIEIAPKSVLTILAKQIDISSQSLYKDGIGGHAGYWFGRLALFDKVTFLFFVLSMPFFILKIAKNRKAHDVFILLTVLSAFITGMVFTIPPPAFHRFSIAFPFVALMIAVITIDAYVILKKKYIKGAILFLILCIIAIMIGNILHFRDVMKTDGPDDPDFPLIHKDLNEENARMVYVASPHKYSLGIVLYIRSDKTINSVNHPLEELLREIPHGRTSYLVIVYPNEESIQRVKEIFPHAQIINKYNTHMLMKIME